MTHKVFIDKKFDSGNLKAFLSLYLYDNAIRIRGAKLMDGKNGLWIEMPSHQGKDGKWRADVDIFRSTDEKPNPAGDALMTELMSQAVAQLSGPSRSESKTTSTNPIADEDIPF